MNKETNINYDEIDLNLRALVRVMNMIPGVKTIGSCGGHKNPQRGQWSEGSWYLKFELDAHCTTTLEYLAWGINNDVRRVHDVTMLPKMPPPDLNPGIHTQWVIECYDGSSPDEVAAFLEKYVLPEVNDVDSQRAARRPTVRRVSILQKDEENHDHD